MKKLSSLFFFVTFVFFCAILASLSVADWKVVFSDGTNLSTRASTGTNVFSGITASYEWIDASSITTTVWCSQGLVTNVYTNGVTIL